MDELLLKLENALWDLTECLDELRVGEDSLPNSELPELNRLYEVPDLDVIAHCLRLRRLGLPEA